MQISIASGKGGTGKTTLAVNLAVAAALGKSPYYSGVQVLDCDVEEPNCHLFLHPSISLHRSVTLPVPEVNESRCTRCGVCGEACAFHAILAARKVLVFPELCHGCGACSYLCPEQCIKEVPRPIGVLEEGSASVAGADTAMSFCHALLNPGEALATPLVERVRERVRPESLAIIDSPPGTSCTMVASVKKSDLCILVTEPTPFGLHDLELAHEALTRLRVPSAVVVNRSDIGDDRVAVFCRSEDLPILAEIPLDRELAHLSADGGIAALSSRHYRDLFTDILNKAIAMVHGIHQGSKLY